MILEEIKSENKTMSERREVESLSCCNQEDIVFLISFFTILQTIINAHISIATITACIQKSTVVETGEFRYWV